MKDVLRLLLRIPVVRRWYYRPVMILPNLARQALQAAAPARPIAVADIMQRYTPDEHLARADAYFADEREEQLFRRPFFSGEDSAVRLAGFATVLQLLDLQGAARVLDFGCGTGWVSRSLGYMGAEVVGVDVSATVLDRARTWLARDPLAAELRVEFLEFDSIRLPLDDASVDRIVSFDAFHHVLDQAATLAEMGRVLKPGGIAVFHEPGPVHSTTPDAQYEMREFSVIENDIDVHAIWAAAQRCGFAKIWMALPALKAPIVLMEQFDRVAAGRPSRTDARIVLQNIFNFSHNLRIFALHKAG